jgi:hypothetical protein
MPGTTYCKTGVLELLGGRKIGGQATQAGYEITVLEGYAKLNDLTGTITVVSLPRRLTSA